MEQLFALDGNILLFIQEHIRNPILSPILIGITHLGDSGIFWIILALLLLCRKRTRTIGIYMACSLVCMFVLNDLLIKRIAARIRPYEVVDGLRILIEKQVDFSFPSGHTAVSFAAIAALWRRIPKKTWICLFVLAALIALSRLYVGVHYPTDVIGGVISGIISAWIGCRIADRIIKHGEKKSGIGNE